VRDDLPPHFAEKARLHVRDDAHVYDDASVAAMLTDCPALAVPLPVTLFTDRRGMGPKELRASLIEVAALLATTPAKSKESQPHFKMGRFGDMKSQKGSYRTNANFLSVAGIEVDYDAGIVTPDQAAEALAAANVAAVLVTSASHGLPGKGQRWRGLFALSEEVAPDERAAMVARVNGIFGGILSDESFTPVTSYGYGHVEGREPPLVRLIEGRYLDHCDDLDARAMGKPAKADLGDPQPAIDQSDDPEAVGHARGRLEAVAEALAAMAPGENRNGALNKAAFQMGGLVACEMLERAEVFEALVAAADECGYSIDYADAERVIEAGLKKGMDHPTPYVSPADLLDDLPDDGEGEVLGDNYCPDQDGAIRAFTDRHRDRLRFDHDRNMWLEFDGHTWRPERTDLARHLARSECMWLAEKYRQGGKGLRHVGVWEAVERGARSVREFAVTSTDWDRNPLILGTPAGVVDLTTGDLLPGRASDQVSKRTAVAPVAQDQFSADLDCPEWLAFLNFALGGDPETIRFLQQWAGIGLTGLTREQKLLFIHGGGGNGKGVAINTLAWVAGDYASDVPSSTLTAKRHEDHPTELARLQGVRFAHASEVERGARWAEQRIKSLTGGDLVTARFMRGDHFTFQPQLTLTVIGNDRPSFTAVDDAIRRRFLLLEMDRRPETPDPNLSETLRTEGPGILSWMIQGALDWHRHGLVIPDSVRRATDQYMAEEDHFSRFLDECGSRTPGARASTTDLHEAYTEWKWGDSAAPDLSVRAVAQEMVRRGFQPVEKVARLDGKRGAGFSGFLLHVEDED